jgi:pimeloyl-ACP methyl ester carboxylesterase
MWQPLAVVLVANHMVIVPDLRGMGLSTHPEGGYEKTSQARDLASILDRLPVDQVVLVTHDIGNMVGYAFAAQLPQRVTKWIALDAPLPGLGTWEKQLLNPLVWHFNFRGPDVERLVAGRERILLDRFYNEMSASRQRLMRTPDAITPSSMRDPARFTTPSAASSPLLRETLKRTKRSLPTSGSFACPSLRSAATIRMERR